MIENCENCKHSFLSTRMSAIWNEKTKTNDFTEWKVLECHYNPPENKEIRWPQVNPSEVCGKWKAR